MMRAKFVVQSVEKFDSAETVVMRPVGPNRAYPEDGTDEDNTFAKFIPGGELKLIITNPALFDTFKVGDKYYADFTKAEG